MTTEIALPICPKCSAEGIEYIVSEASTEHHGTGDEWFNIAFCSKCGHIYGIFNKYSIEPSASHRLDNPFGSYDEK